MSKVLDPIKKLFKKAKANPVVGIGVAVFAVLIVGAVIAFAVFGGGGDDATRPRRCAQCRDVGTPDTRIMIPLL